MMPIKSGRLVVRMPDRRVMTPTDRRVPRVVPLLHRRGLDRPRRDFAHFLRAPKEPPAAPPDRLIPRTIAHVDQQPRPTRARVAHPFPYRDTPTERRVPRVAPVIGPMYPAERARQSHPFPYRATPTERSVPRLVPIIHQEAMAYRTRDARPIEWSPTEAPPVVERPPQRTSPVITRNKRPRKARW